MRQSLCRSTLSLTEPKFRALHADYTSCRWHHATLSPRKFAPLSIYPMHLLLDPHAMSGQCVAVFMSPCICPILFFAVVLPNPCIHALPLRFSIPESAQHHLRILSLSLCPPSPPLQSLCLSHSKQRDCANRCKTNSHNGYCQYIVRHP